MKYKPLIAGLAMVTIGLTGCSASSDSKPAPAPSDSAAPGQGGSSAPATEPSGSSAPTTEPSSSSAPSSQAPAKSLDQMLITGKVAGLSFKKTPADAKKQAGGLGSLVKGLKVQPAKCKDALTQGAKNAANTDAKVAVAKKGTAFYSAGVLSNGPSLRTARKSAEDCKDFKMDVGVPGVKANGKIKTSDLTVKGVSNGYLVVTTVEVSGQKQTTISAVGQAGKTTISVAGAGSATQDKVKEVFTAQAKKVNSS